ncbi:hypothetical protein HDU86_001201 [Geranomyces michiganensis]|nr:hypothetical protein HDU86_001201 [Geranomyces michiganensis]
MPLIPPFRALRLKRKKPYTRTDGVDISDWGDQSTLTDQFKELTADMEARRLEQQDLHAAIELLVRRTAALEQQVLSLGAQPVTKTNPSLSEARLEEIASGVWKKFEHLSGKADATTSRTNSVMTDILVGSAKDVCFPCIYAGTAQFDTWYQSEGQDA